MSQVLSNAADGVTNFARMLLARISDGGADSGLMTMDWQQVARSWPAVARGLVAHADRLEAGVAAVLVVWYRARWRALARGLALVAAARLARVYARTVGKGEDRLACALRVRGGYSLKRMLVRMEGHCELHVPVVGRFRIECAFDSIDNNASEKKAESEEEEQEREEEEVEKRGKVDEDAAATSKSVIMLPLEDKEAAHPEKQDRPDLFYSAKKPRQRRRTSRRQTCNVDDLQALLHEFGQSPVDDGIEVSDIDEEDGPEADREEVGSTLLLSPCSSRVSEDFLGETMMLNKENDALNAMMASPAAKKASRSQQLWTPRTTAGMMIAKSSAVVSTVDDLISGAISVKREDKNREALISPEAVDNPAKSSKRSKRRRRRRRGGDSFIYRPSSIGSSSLLDE